MDQWKQICDTSWFLSVCHISGQNIALLSLQEPSWFSLHSKRVRLQLLTRYVYEACKVGNIIPQYIGLHVLWKPSTQQVIGSYFHMKHEHPTQFAVVHLNKHYDWTKWRKFHLSAARRSEVKQIFNKLFFHLYHFFQPIPIGYAVLRRL